MAPPVPPMFNMKPKSRYNPSSITFVYNLINRSYIKVKPVKFNQLSL